MAGFYLEVSEKGKAKLEEVGRSSTSIEDLSNSIFLLFVLNIAEERGAGFEELDGIFAHYLTTYGRAKGDREIEKAIEGALESLLVHGYVNSGTTEQLTEDIEDFLGKRPIGTSDKAFKDFQEWQVRHSLRKEEIKREKEAREAETEKYLKAETGLPSAFKEFEGPVEEWSAAWWKAKMDSPEASEPLPGGSGTQYDFFRWNYRRALTQEKARVKRRPRSEDDRLS